MTAPDCPFDAEPQEALAAVTTFSGPVLVDLDETLFLRNSTEEFLNCAVPALPTLLMLRLLDIVKPWRWTGGEATRDVWRVQCIVCLFPWTRLVWNRRVVALAAQHRNHRLAVAVTTDARQPTVVTVGFDVVTKPLIEALGFGASQVVSARLFTFLDRRRGKLAMAKAALGEDLIERSLFITDSMDDLPLLQLCAKPLRVVWPDARYKRALSHVYLPGQYVTQVKHPGERYAFRGILQEDFALWVLATIALASHPAMHVAGLLLLLLSFWAIYERGYVDNDVVAARFEAEPKLNAAYWEAPVATPKWQPWVWAMASGACAVPLLKAPNDPLILDYIVWGVWLAVTHSWFWLYNRCDKSTRLWLYGGLQFLRSAAFLTLASSTLIGLLAVAAHISARWFPYLVYRLGSTSWPRLQIKTFRLVLFVTFGALFTVSFRNTTLLDRTGALLLIWYAFQARHELRAIWANAARIDVANKNTG